MKEIMETSNQTPIEIALRVDEYGFTTTKKLYEWLGLDKTHYARWVKENITENPFAEENEFSPVKAKTYKPVSYTHLEAVETKNRQV